MTATTDRLDQIQARADAATDGAWEAHVPAVHWSMPNVRTRRDSLQEGVAYKVATAPDAMFIAAARTDVPALVNALRAVLNLHHPRSTQPICRGCGRRFPCPTVEAIESALGGVS